VLDDYLYEKFRYTYVLGTVSEGQGLIREKKKRKSSGMIVIFNNLIGL